MDYSEKVDATNAPSSITLDCSMALLKRNGSFGEAELQLNSYSQEEYLNFALYQYERHFFDLVSFEDRKNTASSAYEYFTVAIFIWNCSEDFRVTSYKTFADGFSYAAAFYEHLRFASSSTP